MLFLRHFSKQLCYGALFLSGLLFVILAFSWNQRANLQVHQLAPLPQHPYIQVYFNQNLATSYKEPYRHQTRPGDNLEQIIVDQINSAQKTIDLAVQELRLPLVAQALRDRYSAGVRVRVILENTYSRSWSSFSSTEVTQLDQRRQDKYSEYRQLVDQNHDGQITPFEIQQNDALEVIRNAGIPWIDDTADGSKGSGLMHHKFLVIDSQQVIVTSANFTTSDIHGDFSSTASRGNANSLLKFNNAALAALFTQEFNYMWGDGPGGQFDSLFGVKKPYRAVQQVILGDAIAQVQFSPTAKAIPWEQSSNGLIGRTLNNARQTVDMALFVFSEQKLADILETNQQQGVTIRALVDPSFAYRSYSELLDMMGVALSSSTLSQCQFEPNNRPWRQAIKSVGSPRLPPGDLLHHKYGVVDGQVVIVGSHNWSTAADQLNDETLMVIYQPQIAAHYEREFKRLYANSRLGLTKTLRHKIEQQHCDTMTATPTTTPLITAVTPQPTPANAAPLAKASSSLGAQQVNLNTATQRELENLPGVGSVLAQRIIAARQRKPFTALSDLDQIPGVGPKMLEKLEPQVTW